MLTQIDVMSENAFYIPILGISPKDTLLIRKITGLNPPDRNLFIGDYARDGGVYQGNRVGNRNIVITMDLNPNPALGETVSGLRNMLYKAFMDPQPDADHLKIVLHDEDNNELYLVGYTEKFETEIFDSESLCQLSLLCPDPFLRANEETLLTHNSGWITVPFTYGGTADTGFEAYIVITSPVDMLKLQVNGKIMVFDRPFEMNDLVYINTNRGRRAATANVISGDLGAGATYYDATIAGDYDIGDIVFWEEGAWEKIAELDIQDNPDSSPGEWERIDESIVADMTPTSEWLELHSQSNVVKVYGETEDDLGAVIRAFRFTEAYWGI